MTRMQDDADLGGECPCIGVGLKCSLGSSWLSGEIGRVAQADAGYSVEGAPPPGDLHHVASWSLGPFSDEHKRRLLFVSRQYT